ncbi:MAG: hypothetical protein HKN08_04655, partial [Gammaproteobacteria bacterium]|nr:hypothetical protein [Gammaproteobacteria bacterium]
MKKNFLFLLLTFGYVCISCAQTTEVDRNRALDIYRNIIAFQTAAGHNKVPEMASYLATLLKQAGFNDNDIHILPVNDTAALVVKYQGDNSSRGKPILFLAHMDASTTSI